MRGFGARRNAVRSAPAAAQPFHTSKPTTALDQTCALQVNAEYIILATASRRLLLHEAARAAASTPLESGAAGCLHRSAAFKSAQQRQPAHACAASAKLLHTTRAMLSSLTIACRVTFLVWRVAAGRRSARLLSHGLAPANSLTA